jgi:hypothetical protein
MITIEQTVAIPADRRLRLDVALPDTFKPGSALRLAITGDDGPREARVYTGEPFPSIEELKAEARRKTQARFADPSGDALQKYCGALKDVFTEDGLEYQREMRDEWPD